MRSLKFISFALGLAILATVLLVNRLAYIERQMDSKKYLLVLELHSTVAYSTVNGKLTMQACDKGLNIKMKYAIDTLIFVNEAQNQGKGFSILYLDNNGHTVVCKDINGHIYKFTHAKFLDTKEEIVYFNVDPALIIMSTGTECFVMPEEIK